MSKVLSFFKSFATKPEISNYSKNRKIHMVQFGNNLSEIIDKYEKNNDYYCNFILNDPPKPYYPNDGISILESYYLR